MCQESIGVGVGGGQRLQSAIETRFFLLTAGRSVSRSKGDYPKRAAPAAPAPRLPHRRCTTGAPTDTKARLLGTHLTTKRAPPWVCHEALSVPHGQCSVAQAHSPSCSSPQSRPPCHLVSPVRSFFQKGPDFSSRPALTHQTNPNNADMCTSQCLRTQSTSSCHSRWREPSHCAGE